MGGALGTVGAVTDPAAPLASVDLGTNSFHLVIARPTGNNRAPWRHGRVGGTAQSGRVDSGWATAGSAGGGSSTVSHGTPVAMAAARAS